MPSSSSTTLLARSARSPRPLACADGKRAVPGRAAERASADALSARKGEFARHLPLTGEVDAVAAVELKVPRVPTGRVALRKLMPEGTEVKAGEVVARLDSTAFVQQIKDLTLQLSQAEIDLERQLSQNGVLEADKALDVERKRAALQRAEVDADVPEGILPKRDFLEKQMVGPAGQGRRRAGARPPWRPSRPPPPPTSSSSASPSRSCAGRSRPPRTPSPP